MSDDDDGNVPRESRMDVSVQMDDIGLYRFSEFQKPPGRSLEIFPGIVHPLEPERAFVDRKRISRTGGDRVERFSLIGRERRTHRGEMDADSVCTESRG